jgi:transcription elongation GreA/GreB family factor
LVSIQYWSSNRSANVRKADQTTLSDGGRDRINAELARLRKRREHLLTGLVSDEDTVGDSGDAADEIQQAEDVAFVDKQIAKLEGLLHGSGSANTPTGLLPDGAQVTLQLADGRVTTMRVISDVAEIPESPEAGQEDETLSADSPLGLALAGHQPGDTVSYETPQGPQRVQLLSVRLPPQQ